MDISSFPPPMLHIFYAYLPLHQRQRSLNVFQAWNLLVGVNWNKQNKEFRRNWQENANKSWSEFNSNKTVFLSLSCRPFFGLIWFRKRKSSHWKCKSATNYKEYFFLPLHCSFNWCEKAPTKFQPGNVRIVFVEGSITSVDAPRSTLI